MVKVTIADVLKVKTRETFYSLSEALEYLEFRFDKMIDLDLCEYRHERYTSIVVNFNVIMIEKITNNTQICV